jgi:hypothetical protein
MSGSSIAPTTAKKGRNNFFTKEGDRYLAAEKAGINK